MKRPLTLGLLGLVFLAASYRYLPIALEKSLYPPDLEASSPLATELFRGESPLDPVNMWWEARPEEKGPARLDKAERITVSYGQAFIKGTQIPVRDIRDYLNTRVDRGEMEYVVVSAPKDVRWKFIFPVIDQCRKSKVKLVLLDRNAG